MNQSVTSSILLLLLIAVTSSYANPSPQSLRPSVIGITYIVRYQNTICSNADQESGTCLADAECSRRAGTAIGSCANGYGTCCSFKVSFGQTQIKYLLSIWLVICQQNCLLTSNLHSIHYQLHLNLFLVHLRWNNKPEWDSIREPTISKGWERNWHMSSDHREG